VARDEAAAAAAEAEQTEKQRASQRRYRHEVLLARASGGPMPAEPDAVALAQPPQRPSRAAASAKEAAATVRSAEEGHAVENAAFSGAKAPWYAQPQDSFARARPGTEESLPARARREREAMLALRGEGRGAAPPPPAPRLEGKKTIAELRAERVARETEERARAERLLRVPEGPGREEPVDGRSFHASFGNAAKRARR